LSLAQTLNLFHYLLGIFWRLTYIRRKRTQACLRRKGSRSCATRGHGSGVVKTTRELLTLSFDEEIDRLANCSVLVTLSASLTTNLGMNVFVPNSRAVGNSTGRSSFSGQSEAKDLEELVLWCVNKVGNVNHVLLVVSYHLYANQYTSYIAVARATLMGLCLHHATQSSLPQYEPTMCSCHTRYLPYSFSHSSMLQPTEKSFANSCRTPRHAC
jgi:hypothetical protein